MATLVTAVTKASRFPNDAMGLEKSLRFLQATSQIAMSYSQTASTARQWAQARKQINLGRRYLRFFKWIDCFNLAYESFQAQNAIGLVPFLKAGKFSCLGIYLLLESFTIMDAMEIWSTSWGDELFARANEFWFYSIVFSLILGLVQLYELSTKESSSRAVSEKSGTRGSKSPATRSATKASAARTQDTKKQRQAVMKQLCIDGCDLLVPGHATGWITTSPVIVGHAMIVSTLLASIDIWARAVG